MPIDPAYAVKGARVQLVRGFTTNSNIGPQEGGAAIVPLKEAVVADSGSPGGWRPLAEGDDPRLARVRMKLDEKGVQVMGPNPKPPAAGEVFNTPDQNGKVPVKWPDGSWSMVPCEKLDLIAPAPEHVETDPVKARNEALGREAAGRADLERQIGEMRQTIKELAGELAAAGDDLEERAKLFVATQVEGVQARLGKQLGDAIEALLAKIEGQKQRAPDVAPDAAPADAPAPPAETAPAAP